MKAVLGRLIIYTYYRSPVSYAQTQTPETGEKGTANHMFPLLCYGKLNHIHSLCPVTLSVSPFQNNIFRFDQDPSAGDLVTGHHLMSRNK